MKIRLTIEYDPDWDENQLTHPIKRLLAGERSAWEQGHIGFTDIEPDHVLFELVKE